MRKPVAFVTGARGEMGHLLVPALVERGFEVVAADLRPLPTALAARCREAVELDLTDEAGVARLVERIAPAHVFHLAALLSSRAEESWESAHRVNVEATLSLFRLCERLPTRPRFLFPSSIAVYGLPDVDTKRGAGAVTESEWTVPIGIYGCNKLYCETVGAYLSRRGALDFRAIRFPGLISSETLPSGGTTDYAPEMIHAAARGEAYRCFVRPDTELPFLTMTDAVDALLGLADAEGELPRRSFNVRGFAATASALRERVLEHFPDARIEFSPDPARQRFADSWPADVDDMAARRAWGFSPVHEETEAFRDYLIPALRRRYAAESL